MAAGARGVVTVLRDVEVDVDIDVKEGDSGKDTTILKIRLPGTRYKQILSILSED